MQQFFEQIRQLNNKPLMFGIYGALGCLIVNLLLAEPLNFFIYSSVRENVVSNTESPFSAFVYMMAFTGVWMGIISVGISMGVMIGQNHYLHRRLMSKSEVILAILGGFISGLVSGAIAQAIYSVITSITELIILVEISRIFAWGILGIMIGVGMSFIVPNLKMAKGILGGGLGGIIGCIGFIVSSFLFADSLGRILGMAILGFFLGLMIALIEQISRQASVLIHWGLKEKTVLSLGEKAVILGSSPDAHIYLRKDHGYPPITGKIYQQEDKIYLEFDPAYAKQKSMKTVKQELKNGDIRKFDKLSFEIRLSNPNLQKAT
jgi:Ca-activated chloride channel family protein